MRKLAGLFAVFVTLTCTDRESAGPNLPEPLAVISDGRHTSGNAHFFFLPPLVPDPHASGTFDATLSPVVRICTLGTIGCETPPVAEFTTTSGPGSETVRVNQSDENYVVNWQTDQFNLDPVKTYRIQVLVASTLLGFADVDVVANSREAKNVQTGQFIPLVNGTTLPIKFRIEIGAVFVVGEAGGIVTAQGGNVELMLPEGALTQPIGITVTPATDFPGDPGLVPGAEYLFAPEGTQFGKPVRLKIAYNSANVPAGVGEDELRLHKVINGHWVEVFGSMADASAHAVSGDITSFSQYGVVRGRQVGSVIVSPAAATIAAGCTAQLEGTVLDPDGNPISRPIIWSSDNTGVARADQTGLVTAITPGVVTVRGTTQPQSATAQITVTAPAAGQAGFCILIDATALTGTRLSLAGVEEFATGSSVPVTARLLPGTYFIYDIVGGVNFTVSGTGTVDYAPELDAILAGRGSNQLTVFGIPITIDATALTGGRLNLHNVHEFATGTSVLVTARLLPGTYVVSDIVGSAAFTVNAAGTVDFAPELNGVFSGRGTNQLTVSGLAIGIDATALSGGRLNLHNTHEYATGTSVLVTARLLPGTYVVSDIVGSAAFTVNAAGTVDFAPELNGVFSGRGTSDLTVTGLAIGIDATALTGGRLNLGNVHEFATGTSIPVTARLLPGVYTLSDIVGSADFTMLSTGMVDYVPELNGVFSGRGTNQLTVSGLTITIDATALGVSDFQLASVAAFSASNPVAAHLLLGEYRFASVDFSFDFMVLGSGGIDYDTSLDSRVSGRGTNMLTVQ